MTDTLPPLPEPTDDLYWHALNYRTAGIAQAEVMWQELSSFVERKIASAQAAEREACAALCNVEAAHSGVKHTGHVLDGLAAKIRARKP